MMRLGLWSSTWPVRLAGCVYLALLYPAMAGLYVSTERWFGAFLLSAVGALVMTRRLISPDPRELRNPWPSHRP